jgi:NTP pyrophosphatase (non-canonical NTP hydrolase)
MAEKLEDKAEWTRLEVRIPPELSGYGPSLKRFFDAMVFKLRRNAHKGRWEDVLLASAIQGLERERLELEQAVIHGNTSEILMEAADVANQALIAAEIALEARGV